MKERESIAARLRDFSKTLAWLFAIVDIIALIGAFAGTYSLFKYGDAPENLVLLAAIVISAFTIILSQTLFLKMAKGIAELLCPASESKDKQKELRVKVNVDEPANISDTLASV